MSSRMRIHPARCGYDGPHAERDRIVPVAGPVMPIQEARKPGCIQRAGTAECSPLDRHLATERSCNVGSCS